MFQLRRKNNPFITYPVRRHVKHCRKFFRHFEESYQRIMPAFESRYETYLPQQGASHNPMNWSVKNLSGHSR